MPQDTTHEVQAERYESEVAIRNAVQAGAIFFVGTPHRGSSKANMTRILFGFQTLYGSHKGLVSSLEVGAEILDRLQQEFKHVMNRFDIYSCKEEFEFRKGLGKASTWTDCSKFSFS
jgi:hypothetical protein